MEIPSELDVCETQMKTNNSLDLISDINTQVSKLKKKTQRGGALKKLNL